MNVPEFKQAAVSASKTGGSMKERTSGQHLDKKINNSRPPSGLAKTNLSKDKVDMKSAEEKCERVKLLREKQIEDRKKKYEERKAAVEDRRRQKEREDSVKNEALKHLIEHKTTTASRTTSRKLPNLPGEANAHYPRRETSGLRRLSSSSSSGDSLGHTPPGSGKRSYTTRRNLTGPTSASTSSLNSFGGSHNLGKNLGATKKASVSTNNLNEKTSKDKPTVVGTTSRRSVGSALPKAQSMGAIHQVGHGAPRGSGSRPPSRKKGKPKPTHHAGTSSEQEAKQALAERRKRIREEAERKALLDKEKQEELQRQREEEEKQLAEENAKEMARQEELAKQLEELEAERARSLKEQREKEAEIEAEKMAAEMRQKEELELLKKQEMERRAKEAEKREKEEEERLKREELERQERRKRVEMIMSRTRMTSSSVNNNMIKAESYSSLEDLSVKLSDEHNSSTVSEILQKVKEKRASPSPEKDMEQQKENHQFLEMSGKESKNENSSDVLRIIDNSKHGHDVDDQNLDTGKHADDCQRVTDGTLMDIGSTLKDFHGTSMARGARLNDISSTIRGTDSTSRYHSGSSSVDLSQVSLRDNNTSSDTFGFQNVLNGAQRNAVSIGTTGIHIAGDNDGTLQDSDGSQGTLKGTYNTRSTSKDNGGNPKRNGSGVSSIGGDRESYKRTQQDTELWKNVEHAMISAEDEVRENLKRNGAMADDPDDEDGEEGQLWKVVEGKRDISEIV